MPLTPTALSANLQGITDSDNEPAAINGMATAFDSYMALSAANGIPLNPGIAATAKAAMIGALTGMSSPNAGATAIQTGVTAYWTALNVPGAYGISIPPTTPPPAIGTLGAALTGVFSANVAGKLPKPAACDAIAAVWHPIMLGGVALFPGVPNPLPFPIL